jgi:hypothetical protein
MQAVVVEPLGRETHLIFLELAVSEAAEMVP